MGCFGNSTTVIIIRTPYRISLFGGGTDHPSWYKKHGGAVIGFAINQYCWITLRELPPFFPYKYRIVYSKEEHVNHANEINHPVIRELLSQWELDNGHSGFEIHHDGDVPARAGLGSSSSFAVGFLHAIHTQYGNYRNKYQLLRDAIFLEQQTLHEVVGDQDQIFASWGGLNRIDFSSKGFSIKPLHLSKERVDDLLNHLMLFFTGFQRTASEIEFIKFYDLSANYNNLKYIHSLVDKAEELLLDTKKPIIEIGYLLDKTWRAKKELATDLVSNPFLDRIYYRALCAGAVGGKLLGAGGGGFFLFCVQPEVRNYLRQSLSDLIEIPIGIDWEGSTVIYSS